MTILVNAVSITARVAAATKVDPPPTMARHTSEEFQYAQRSLHEMVANSALFPDRAERADWFRPRDAIIGTNGRRSKSKDDGDSIEPDNGSSRRERRPSEDSAASTVATCESSASSFDVSDDDNGPPNAPAKSSRIPSEEVLEYSSVPAIREEDVEYGALLGAGGFGEVRLARLKEDKLAGGTSNGDQYCYAMKYLSPTKLTAKEDRKPDQDGRARRNKQFERGIADLAIEARFLATLSHANIIEVHYVGEGELEAQFNCEDGEGDYRHRFGAFLLLDPLVETLAKRIEATYLPEVFGGVGNGKRSPICRSSGSSYWKRVVKKVSNRTSLPLDDWKGQLAKRLESLKGVASALQYLHDDCRVIYRDIKPENIGFYRKPNLQCQCGKRSQESAGDCACYTEITKLFDFGLAKELKPENAEAYPLHRKDPNADPTYKLTARSGSRRYMSPEVCRACPYNEKADVYSFGVLLYQVASLVTPFDRYSSTRLEIEVLVDGHRPDVSIPRGRVLSRKVGKERGVPYAEWRTRFANMDFEEKNERLALRTKCVWTEGLRVLIEECWREDMRSRPRMRDVVARMEGCVRELVSTADVARRPGDDGAR